MLVAALAAGCTQDAADAADLSPGDDLRPVAVGDAASPVDAAAPDLAVADDAGADLATPVDASPDLAAGDDASCPSAPVFNFTCDPNDPATCPKGLCIANQCIGAQLDQHQFDGCGDGVCGACETAKSCPADCAPPPVFSGKKVYDDPNTITVWLHGFTNHTASDLQKTVYGALKGCGDVGDAVTTFKVGVPCGADPKYDTAPNQVVAVEYYGAIAPAWMTPQDVKEVEQYPYLGGPTGLQRYGLIVAKFIKWRMAHTGATHVNLACHSMGCLLARYVIENDIEQLASKNMIVRWSTSAGVVAGAQLAQLYNNPAIQMAADQIGLAVDDFALMNPPYVQTYAASWDHKLWEGNNPLLGGILIHHGGATNPAIAQALNIQLLNLNNPRQYPNDGIMFTLDEMFASQSAAGSVHTPGGAVVAATHSFDYIGHQEATSSLGYRALLVAGLYHRRKVFVTIDSITLKKDHEFTLATPLELGTPPGEVVAETEVRYDPYTMPKYGVAALVDNDKMAYWSAPEWSQTQGSTLMPGQVIFAGPVFDDQTEIALNLVLTESDWYVRYGVQESGPALTDRELLNYNANVQLMDQSISVTGDGADIKLGVKVIPMY